MADALWRLGVDVGGAADVLFPWVKSGGVSENWVEGLGLFALGLLGALVTAYLFLGEFLPSMGGKATYDVLSIEIEDLARRRNDVLALRERYVRGELSLTNERLRAAERLTEQLTQAHDAKQTEASRLRTHLLLVGFPMYVLVGGAFAVLFATNLLQALLIGFGWTAVADRIGLQRELEQKGHKREEQVDRLAEEARSGREARQELEATRSQLMTLQRLTTMLRNNISRGQGGT